LGFTYADGDFREQPIACCTEEQGKDRAKKTSCAAEIMLVMLVMLFLASQAS
jgi:hypothetical protein